MIVCDCYCPKCENCNNEVSIHIADFCVRREKVKVYCPKKACQFEGRKMLGLNNWKYQYICTDMVQDISVIFPNHSSYKGKNVLILSTDAKAYGICLNG